MHTVYEMLNWRIFDDTKTNASVLYMYNTQYILYTCMHVMNIFIFDALTQPLLESQASFIEGYESHAISPGFLQASPGFSRRRLKIFINIIF